MEAFFFFAGIGIMMALSRWSKSGFPGLQNTSSSGKRRIPVAYRADPEQRKETLEAYKYAVAQKMAVMRAAIEQGWGDDELKRLDERLEQLIGKDDMQRLQNGELPANGRAAEGLDGDLEVARLRGAAQPKAAVRG
jgi:hypothetical protein